ncbi:hypothetical protein GGS20DRAFT_593069 [Poronia punctata]|nr:hypothetical protein GGS20DRAFT_593069 [Poronia punctata]
MSIFFCCRKRVTDDHSAAIELPAQPPRAKLSKTLSRSDPDMYLPANTGVLGRRRLNVPTYHSIVDPDAVEVEDSDDDMQERHTAPPTPSTLGAFKTKLIRRLSHRADTKPACRLSVGNSDEELARRAELKRLMHKRIQEELKDEEVGEKEESRRGSPNSSSVNKRKDSDLPGGGPRDTIEFSVPHIEEKKSSSEGATQEMCVNMAPVVNKHSGPRHQASSHGIPNISTDVPNKGDTIFLEETRLVNKPQTPSRLSPVHLLGGSGRRSPSTASWRLSYNADNIDTFIDLPEDSESGCRQTSSGQPEMSSRSGNGLSYQQNGDDTNYSSLTTQEDVNNKTAQEESRCGSTRSHQRHDLSTYSNITENGRNSPMSVWLRSQELHSASVISSRPNSEIVAEHDHTSSKGSSSLNRVLDHMKNKPGPKESPAHDQAQDASSQHTSSRYTTGPDSRQGTPRGSGISYVDVSENRGDMQMLSTIYGAVSPYQMTTSSISDTGSYRTAMNGKPSLELVNFRSDDSQFHPAEIFPASASETASFQQREEELKSVEKRFGVAPARRYTTAPVHSRFREEFEELRSSNSTRSSILSKLHIPYSKRVRNFSSQSDSSKRSIASSTDLGKMVISRPLEEDAVNPPQGVTQHGFDHPNGWLRAKMTRRSIPRIDISDMGRDVAFVGDESGDSPKAHSTTEAGGCSVKNCYPTRPSTTAQEELIKSESNDPVDIHTGVLQEWVEQLQAEEALRQSRTASRITIPKRQPPRPRTPPASWAKWPSTTRLKRTGCAGERDRVVTRDFAITGSSRGLETELASEGLPNGDDETLTSKKLSRQVSKALKSSWGRITQQKGGSARPSDKLESKNYRRSQGFLEYPELELLPTAEGLREVQALEKQIDTMKRRSVSGRRMLAQSSSESTQRPFTTRIADVVHKLQLEVESTLGADDNCHRGYPLGSQFLTPAHALFIPRSKSCAPDMVGTPQSHFSYEDCAQDQLRDHDDAGHKDLSRQNTTRLKRAKSTGNIEIKLPGETGATGGAQDGPKPIHRTWKSTLRKQKSFGWVHGSTRGKDDVVEAA